LLDVIVEHSDAVLDLLVGEVGKLSSNFVEVGREVRLCHWDFKFFLNYVYNLSNSKLSLLHIFYNLYYLLNFDWSWNSQHKKFSKTSLDSGKKWVMPELEERGHKEEKLKWSQNQQYIFILS
jgi:hypothetical protein